MGFGALGFLGLEGEDFGVEGFGPFAGPLSPKCPRDPKPALTGSRAAAVGGLRKPNFGKPKRLELKEVAEKHGRRRPPKRLRQLPCPHFSSLLQLELLFFVCGLG